jgi:hypothetical protein
MVLASCTTTPPVQKRWASETVVDAKGKPVNSGPVANPELWVGAFSSDPAAPLSTKDLPDHAAAAYIEALAKAPDHSPDALRSNMSKPLAAPKPVLDTTSLDRTLVITLTKGDFQPADRLVRTEIALDPIGFTFSNYAAAATIYSTVNIETLGATKSASNGVELDPTFGGFLKGSAKLTSGNSESYTDQASVSEQIEQLTVYMRGNQLVVYRESERGIDLTGSTLVKITFKADPSLVDSQWIVTSTKLVDDKTGRYLSPDKAAISISLSQLSRPKNLKVSASARYIQRHVVQGAETYSENDDVVQLISDQLANKEFTLVPARDWTVKRWEPVQDDDPILVFDGGASGKDIRQGKPIFFTDYDSALSFAEWLQETGSSTIGAMKLARAGDKPIAKDVKVKLVPYSG